MKSSECHEYGISGQCGIHCPLFESNECTEQYEVIKEHLVTYVLELYDNMSFKLHKFMRFFNFGLRLFSTDVPFKDAAIKVLLTRDKDILEEIILLYDSGIDYNNATEFKAKYKSILK